MPLRLLTLVTLVRRNEAYRSALTKLDRYSTVLPAAANEVDRSRRAENGGGPEKLTDQLRVEDRGTCREALVCTHGNLTQ